MKLLSTATPGSISTLDKRIREQVNVSWLLLLPLLVILLGIFVVPFLLLIRISLHEPSRFEAYAPGTWSIESYEILLNNDLFWSIFVTTSKIALIATISTVFIGLFYAYVLWRADGWVLTALLLAMVLPLLTTLVVKLYSLVLLLAPLGTVNDLFTTLGLVSEPLPMMNNLFGVVVALTYTTIPYAALPIYAVLDEMDVEILEASRDLGAGKVRSFYEIVIPQAIPGIIVSTVLAFVWNFGAFASPALLGSGSERTLGVETNYYLNEFNWARSAALSIIMLVVVIACTIALLQILSRRGGGLKDVT